MLSEQLCSLVPGHDRLAFSVIFTMTKAAKVVKKWFGKTVIRFAQLSFLPTVVSNVFHFRSAAKLAYKDAQDVIEGQVLGDVAVAPEHDAADIAHDIKVLENLAKQMRAHRFENGTLSLDSLRLSFKLDDNGLPTDCWQYKRTDANDLIEEVNISLG